MQLVEDNILFTNPLAGKRLIDLFWLHVAFFKRWWGKNQHFMIIRLFNDSDLIVSIGVYRGAWRCAEVCTEVCRGVCRCAEGAWRCTEVCMERCTEVHGEVHRGTCKSTKVGMQVCGSAQRCMEVNEGCTDLCRWGTEVHL